MITQTFFNVLCKYADELTGKDAAIAAGLGTVGGLAHGVVGDALGKTFYAPKTFVEQTELPYEKRIKKVTLENNPVYKNRDKIIAKRLSRDSELNSLKKKLSDFQATTENPLSRLNSAQEALSELDATRKELSDSHTLTSMSRESRDARIQAAKNPSFLKDPNIEAELSAIGDVQARKVRAQQIVDDHIKYINELFNKSQENDQHFNKKLKSIDAERSAYQKEIAALSTQQKAYDATLKELQDAAQTRTNNLTESLEDRLHDSVRKFVDRKNARIDQANAKILDELNATEKAGIDAFNKRQLAKRLRLRYGLGALGAAIPAGAYLGYRGLSS